MRKKDKSQRNPVPEDPVQNFSVIVHLLATNLGISKLPQLSKYVDDLVEACARYTFEEQHPVPTRRKEDKEKKAAYSMLVIILVLILAIVWFVIRKKRKLF